MIYYSSLIPPWKIGTIPLPAAHASLCTLLETKVGTLLTRSSSTPALYETLEYTRADVEVTSRSPFCRPPSFALSLHASAHPFLHPQLTPYPHKSNKSSPQLQPQRQDRHLAVFSCVVAPCPFAHPLSFVIPPPSHRIGPPDHPPYCSSHAPLSFASLLPSPILSSRFFPSPISISAHLRSLNSAFSAPPPSARLRSLRPPSSSPPSFLRVAHPGPLRSLSVPIPGVLTHPIPYSPPP
ncbi:hypothetical protein C8J57DRAFT_1492306 [Mycena rebaudengoi]|nr:hypothetical protein C8J57DRAFT_1492306 [Mycena rebaudengoi]